MATVKSLILYEKWRPKTLEDIILLPRIRKKFINGIDQHYIFYGHHGTGKTSLARILIGEYSKKTPYLEINCSLDTSIDMLREEIGDFCKFSPMLEEDSDFKYVFLDEFERVSKNFQDGFKAFIEKYNDYGIRFIISTNHISKLTPQLKSRIKSIDFDCRDVEEEKYLRNEIAKRIVNVILPKENKEIPKEHIKTIVTKKFPDFRAMLVDVQDFIISGEVDETSNISNKLKLDLFNLIYDDSIDYEKIYHRLMSDFGPDKIDDMIKILGTPFINWSILEGKNIDKLFECNYVIADYYPKLDTATDPIILGMTVIGKFRDILL
jgi:DNA polymerase III delta prime subunit